MRGERLQVWRNRIGIWLPALVFFALNLTGWLIYLSGFSGEAAAYRDQVNEAEERLATLTAQRQELEGILEKIDETQESIRGLYEEIFATERQRLTAAIREVRQMARDANLEPRQTNYPEETLEEYGLQERSFVFSVHGTYFDLRKLVNSLELSESFLTLEEVGLSGDASRGGPQLSISLRLSTLFAEPTAVEAQGAPGAGGTS